MKLLKLGSKAYEQYKTTVHGNKNIHFDQAQKKLTRNVMLVKEFFPERIHRGILGTIYSYGNLDIFVVFGKVYNIVNHKGVQCDWKFPKKRYIELNKKLGILDCKFSRKLS